MGESAVTGLDELRVPKAMRSRTEQVVAVTDEFCHQYLDAEYADLCRRLVGKLARKRPSPLSRGDVRIWAAGVVYALGQVNFIFDRSQPLHMPADRLSELLGVKKTTMTNKARMVRDACNVGNFDTEFMRRELADASPLTWLLDVNGLPADARHLPMELQVQAHRQGLIPYVPALGRSSEEQAPAEASTVSGSVAPDAAVSGTEEVLDRLVAEISVDCYDEDELMWAFAQVFNDDAELPARASLLGAPVEVAEVDYHGEGRGLVAHCRREDYRQELTLTELAFPADTVAAWIHAAYCHLLGIEPFPVTPRPDWTPSFMSGWTTS